jgi:hypothetical protein
MSGQTEDKLAFAGNIGIGPYPVIIIAIIR